MLPTVLRLTLALAGLLAARAPVLAADKLRVVATTPDLAAVARSVGGDAAEVTALARPGEDPHFVDAKPSFIVTLNKADVLIEGGAALEAGWLPPLLDAARNPRIAVGSPGRVVASEGIALLDVPSRLDRSMGDVHPYGNSHYMLDPANAKIVASTVARALCQVDHARCPTYEKGAGDLTRAIDDKLAAWQSALGPFRGAKMVSYHKNFDYFAERFGLQVVGSLEPKPGIPPSPAHIAGLVPRMKAEGVRLVVVETYRERETPAFVAEKTGARVVAVPIMPGTQEAPDYVALIDYDVRQIAEALKP
jgi:zinc/manganese transport system substrate-binding protein